MPGPCSPLFHLDDKTSALLAMQNVTNAPVTVSGALHYGTGAPGTPNGTISLVNTPRGDASKNQTINVPNWASATDPVLAEFNDWVQ